MLLQLNMLSSFIFIFLLLQPPVSTAVIAKHGCQDRCGDLSIPYPFGVGSGCSFDPSFTISCNTSTYPPKPYLSIIDKELIEINETYIRVKYPNLVSVCYDLSNRTETNVTKVSYKHSMSVNLSGTPYLLSAWNRLIAIGCDDVVLQSNGSSSGGCSAFCADKDTDAGNGVGFCPNDSTSLGNGCCQAEISRGTSIGFLGAQLFDLSGKLLRRKLFPCSYAFIQEMSDSNETIFSYPLYYLHNSTTLLNDNWASTTRPHVVRLDWKIGAKNCKQAKENLNTYACRDEKSVCMDDQDTSTGLGYMCMCIEGYEGNPYLPQGCKAISFSSSISKPGCRDQCGKLSIPFPFGVGKNCYLAPSFEIICNTSTNPAKAYLSVLNAEIIELSASQVVVEYPNLGFACYNSSDNEHGITKTQEHKILIDLSRTQYTLSNENRITAIGCDDMVVGIIGQANQSFIHTGCATVCQDTEIFLNHYGDCPYIGTTYQPSDGCCMALIPRGTTYLEVYLNDLSGRWPRTNFSCSYAFVGYDQPTRSFRISNNLMAIPPDDSLKLRNALDWRVGDVNCNEARWDSASFACKDNSDCVDFDVMVGGYLCKCSEGYQGNPYLNLGCQDINECDDDITHPCNSNSTCINTHGSVLCLCPKGYIGDGKKNGTGCILLPQSKTKMIILTGMGSALGILLVILMCFWLYKALQKRREQILKDNFFKRNGGLLLQQHTNEGVLGNTKVFQAKELEVATNNFNESRILGQGGQGIVYKGMLYDGKIVAIKKSKLVEENQLEQFINEVVILSQINHRNVLKLLGCCLETQVPLLVYEFMPNGTLFDLIHDSNNGFPFLWDMRLKIAADIAAALAYLHHASSMPIYHRDIKSSNILLDEKYIVKVSDFRISRLVSVDQTHLTTMVKGTFGYLDPEYFRSSQFTEKSDVYSFGVVLVELITRKKPISLDKRDDDDDDDDDERSLAARFLTSMEKNCLDTILDPQILEQGRKEEIIEVASIAQRCLNLKGKLRPTMKEVATKLENCKSYQVSSIVEDEFEEVRGSKAKSVAISDSEYTWTTSCKSACRSSLDAHPLLFSTE